MPGSEIAYWLFYARFATVHVSAIILTLAAAVFIIVMHRLDVKRSLILALFAAGLHEAIFNPVWIVYFRDWTVFSNLQTLYLFKFMAYFAFTFFGLKYFKGSLEHWSLLIFYLLVWVLSGFPTSVPLPNGAGNASAAGNFWEFGYNIIYAVTFAVSIKPIQK